MHAASRQKSQKLVLVGLHLLVICAAIYAWSSGGRLQHEISVYQIFPLAGLLAFSLMWLHYVTAAANRLAGQTLFGKRYYEATESAVLGLILLHPALFLYQLWHDGFGLPPDSYTKYVGVGNSIFVAIAILALFIFLLYESKERVKKTKFWPYLVWLNNFAMIFIFVHAWKLGGSLRADWFRVVWVFYFVVFILCLVQKYTSPEPVKQ